MSTSSVYNHRPMQPAGVRTNTAQEVAQPHTTFSIVEPLETIKHEFEGVHAELARVRSQKDDMETKLEAQVAELASIRRALFDLENEHNRIRQQYEDEISRLRGESIAIRQSAAPQPTNSVLGNPGRPRGPGLSEASPRFTTPAQPEPPQLRPHSRSISRGPPRLSERERELPPDKMTGESSDRDVDRLSDHREPKRHKARRENHPDMFPPPMGSQHSQSRPQSQPHAPGQLPVKPSFNNSLGLYRFPGQDNAPGGSGLPPMNLSPPNPPNPSGDELTLQNVPPEFRKDGGDWYVVYNPKVKKALDVNLIHTFNHLTVVCCVRFSADGRYLATGCNRTAQIFDVTTGQKVCVVEDDTAPKEGDLYIRSVRFSPDGKLLATGAEDRKIRVWDIAKRRIRHIFDGHQQEIYSLDFSRDGRHIVSGSGDKTMRIWNIQDNSCRTITISDGDSLNNDSGVTSVAISPDGTLVAAGSLDTVVRIWDIASGMLLERLRGHTDSVYSVAFTPDGKGIVSGSLDKTLKYWDVTNLVNSFSRTKPDPTSGSSAITPAPSSSAINFVGHKDFVLSVSMSNDGRWILSGSKDRCVHFWDSRTAALQFMLQGHKNSVISLDINPLGGMLATGSGDYTARIWSYSPF